MYTYQNKSVKVSLYATRLLTDISTTNSVRCVAISFLVLSGQLWLLKKRLCVCVLLYNLLVFIMLSLSSIYFFPRLLLSHYSVSCLFTPSHPKLITLLILPLSLYSALGSSTVPLSLAFVNRLSSRSQDVYIKSAILDFISAAVETQPSVTELFMSIEPHGALGEWSVTLNSFICYVIWTLYSVILLNITTILLLNS